MFQERLCRIRNVHLLTGRAGTFAEPSGGEVGQRLYFDPDGSGGRDHDRQPLAMSLSSCSAIAWVPGSPDVV